MTELNTAVTWVSFSRYWLVQGIGLLSCVGVSIELARKFAVKYRSNQAFRALTVASYILSGLGGSVIWFMMSSRPGLFWLPLGLLLVLTIR